MIMKNIWLIFTAAMPVDEANQSKDTLDRPNDIGSALRILSATAKSNRLPSRP